MENIELKIRNSINEALKEELYKDASNIGKDENLFNIGLDSLNIVKLIMLIESEFNIMFDDDEIAAYHWKNIDKIETMIKNKI